MRYGDQAHRHGGPKAAEFVHDHIADSLRRHLPEDDAPDEKIHQALTASIRDVESRLLDAVRPLSEREKMVWPRPRSAPC